MKNGIVMFHVNNNLQYINDCTLKLISDSDNVYSDNEIVPLLQSVWLYGDDRQYNKEYAGFISHFLFCINYGFSIDHTPADDDKVGIYDLYFIYNDKLHIATIETEQPKNKFCLYKCSYINDAICIDETIIECNISQLPQQNHELIVYLRSLCKSEEITADGG